MNKPDEKYWADKDQQIKWNSAVNNAVNIACAFLSATGGAEGLNREGTNAVELAELIAPHIYKIISRGAPDKGVPDDKDTGTGLPEGRFVQIVEAYCEGGDPKMTPEEHEMLSWEQDRVIQAIKRKEKRGGILKKNNGTGQTN